MKLFPPSTTQQKLGKPSAAPPHRGKDSRRVVVANKARPIPLSSLTLLRRLFLLAARQSVQAPSALAPQRRFIFALFSSINIPLPQLGGDVVHGQEQGGFVGVAEVGIYHRVKYLHLSR